MAKKNPGNGESKEITAGWLAQAAGVKPEAETTAKVAKKRGPKPGKKRGPKPGKRSGAGRPSSAEVKVKRGPGRPKGKGKKRGPKPGAKRGQQGGGLIAKAVAKLVKKELKANNGRTKELVKAVVAKELKRALKALLS